METIKKLTPKRINEWVQKDKQLRQQQLQEECVKTITTDKKFRRRISDALNEIREK